MNPALKSLKIVEARLETLKPGDQESIIKIGAGLEEAISNIADSSPDVNYALQLCLETLQALYLESLDDPGSVITPLKELVGAAERFLRSGQYASLGPVHSLGKGLWLLIGRSEAECPFSEAIATPRWPGSSDPAPGAQALPLYEEAGEVEQPETKIEVSAHVEPVSQPIAAPISLEESDTGGVDQAIIDEFLAESSENLDRLDQDLLDLEKDSTNPETLSSIFRTIHTIKGTCGFLGFSRLEALTHAGENLLSLLRDGKLHLTPAITDALLSLVDATRNILSQIDEHSQEGTTDYSALVQTLERLQQNPNSSALSHTRADENPYQPIPGSIGDTLIQLNLIQPQDLAAALQEQESGDQRRLGEILISKGLITPEALDKALQSTQSTARSHVESSIRVDVELLDRLMTLVGELVLARNQLVQFTTSRQDPALTAASQRLNHITTELQEQVMKTRMQPIDRIWSKLPRVVRDLAHTCGKEVRLELIGKETDLDKTLIEAIKDPLTHLVRNAIDHGIEPPEARKKAGKSSEGILRLSAYHEGGQVNIEIADDGGGIPVSRIRAKALERGLITEEQAAQMSERETMQLIFQPGFSTAAAVTNVSGRGVGMDVVKTNIEKIGGTVDIQSQLGLGTTIKVKVPLTLAIIPALMVNSGGERFAIPQASLLELVRLEPERALTAIEQVHGAPVYRLRGTLLPLVYLHKELVLSAPAPAQAVNIVVLQADGRQFGLVVDAITDTEEIVVKPLGAHLSNIPVFSGATIMGDGKVALILDLLSLAKRAHVVTEAHERLTVIQSDATEDASLVQTLLLFRVESTCQMAVPLSTVARLEEFPKTSIESVGGRDVVQYRGQIMPLLRIFSSGYPAEADTVPVIVAGSQKQQFGLVVDEILDIIEERIQIQSGARDGLILGTAVLQGRVTEILDAAALCDQAASLFMGAE